MQINAKWVMWFGVWTSLLLLIGSSPDLLHNVVPDAWIVHIVAVCIFLVKINNVLLTAGVGFSSNEPGPLSKLTMQTASKAVIFFMVAYGAIAIRIVAVLILVVIAIPAMAQTREARVTLPAPQQPFSKPLICDPLKLLPGCAVSTPGGGSLNIDDIVKNIQAAIAPDLAYAKALADAAATPGSKLRSQCLNAIITTQQQLSGSTLKNPDGTPMTPPEPDVITKLEQGAEIIDALQPTGPLISGCAAAANAAGQNVLAIVNSFVTGVAIKAATGGVL